MITDKFNKDFSKGNIKIKKIIQDIVTDYFSKEKVTEESLRLLKQNVSKAVEEYKKTSQSGTYIFLSILQKKAIPSKVNQSPQNKILLKEKQ